MICRGFLLHNALLGMGLSCCFSSHALMGRVQALMGRIQVNSNTHYICTQLLSVRTSNPPSVTKPKHTSGHPCYAAKHAVTSMQEQAQQTAA